MFSTRNLSAICLLSAIAVSCFTPDSLFAADQPAPTFVQALVGAAQFSEDDLTFAETSAIDGTTSGNDLSTMPYVGMTFQHPFGGESTQFGIDGSFLFGWRSDDTKVRAGNGQVAISIDSSLWLADLSVGAYVTHTFSDRWRLYVAAGPAIVFGDYSEDTDEENEQSGDHTKATNSESEFGIGAYVRGGFDYLFAPNAYVGVCVRGLKTNIEFDSAPDASSSLSGAQGFLTFSRFF